MLRRICLSLSMLVVHLTILANPRLDHVTTRLAKNGFTKTEISDLFSDPRLAKIRFKKLSGRKVNWTQFIKQLLAEESVARGRQFLQEHETILKKFEQQWGVGKEHLAAIARIETNFGNFLGNYTVFNVFYTRLVSSPSKKQWLWAADNIVALALYCKQTGVDCFSIKGSHAGAFGLTQFLPYSLIRFGVDADGDGTINLFQPADAVASAAAYLKAHGWTNRESDQKKSLARYYGSSTGYPKAALLFAQAIR